MLILLNIYPSADLKMKPTVVLTLLLVVMVLGTQVLARPGGQGGGQGGRGGGFGGGGRYGGGQGYGGGRIASGGKADLKVHHN